VIHPRRSLVPSQVLAATAASLIVLAAAGASAAEDPQVQKLREQLERQQAVIESQEARLQQQERLLRDLAARIGPPAPATATVVAAPVAGAALASGTAVAKAEAEAIDQLALVEAKGGPDGGNDPEPARPGPVGTRFAGLDVTLAGALRTTVTTTTARMQPDATPFFVLPKIPGVPDGTTKIDARLSSLLISIKGAQQGDFQLGGMIYAYLFDGDLLSGKYGLYPGFAYIDATSDKWRFAAGLQQDVFSPMMPTMVDRMSAFAGSGNAGNSFKPQLRVERFFVKGTDRLVIQGAIADALPSNIKPGFVDSTENTGVPNLEGRIAWTRGNDREATLPWPKYVLGLSGATGRFRTLYDRNPDPNVTDIGSYTTTLSGVAVEGSWRLTDRFGVQGEVYSGKALGAYLATAFQTVNATERAPISSDGYWGEAAYYWTPKLHSHLGYGIDRPDKGDGPGIGANETAFANLFWDPSPMTTLGFEATWRQTALLAGFDPLGRPIYVDNDGFAFMLSSELRF